MKNTVIDNGGNLAGQIKGIIENEIMIFEDKPESYNDNGEVEGLLSAEPYDFVFQIYAHEELIPHEIEIHSTFIPWYAADENIDPKEYGYQDSVGVDISLTLTKIDRINNNIFDVIYSVDSITETV